MPSTRIDIFSTRLAIRRCLRFIGRASRVSAYQHIILNTIAMLLASSMAAQQTPSSPGQASTMCSLFPISLSAQTEWKDEEFLTAYASQAARIQDLDMTAMVRASGGAGYRVRNDAHVRPSPATIQFRVPFSLRMTGVIPFATRRSFDVSSDGRELRLLVPDGKVMRFYIGSVEAPATSDNPRENLRPQPLIDALHWPQAKLVLPASPSRQGKTRTLDLELNNPTQKEAKTAEVEFDQESGVIAQLAIKDKAGHTITEVRYRDWQWMTKDTTTEKALCFPRHIDLAEPGQNIELEIKILSLTLNTPIPPSTFRLNPPRGVVVTRLALPNAGGR